MQGPLVTIRAATCHIDDVAATGKHHHTGQVVEVATAPPDHGWRPRVYTRIGRWCVRRRGVVVIAWLVALLGLGAISGALGNDVSTDFDLPDVESRAGFEVLDDSFGGFGAGAQGQIVFQSASGFEDPALQASIEEFLIEVDRIENTDVRSPFSPPVEDPQAALTAMTDFLGDGFDPSTLAGPGQVSGDGTIAYAEVELPGEIDQEAAAEFSEEVQDLAPQIDGLRIEYGGQLFGNFEPPQSEFLGLAFAIVILILAFGSVLAMGLPIGVALGGIGVGSTLLLLLSNVMSMPEFATTLGIMIGLGVGIDYALFIVTRYREQLAAGHTVEESVGIAMDTSGRAVTFAGITVVISLLGMLIMGVAFINGLAIGSATVVTVTLLASLTLLPALLGFVGNRIEVTRWRGIIAAGFVVVALIGFGLAVQPLLIGFPVAVVVLVAGLVFAPLKKPLPPRSHKPIRETSAYRWSRFVQARPWTIAIGSAAALLVMAAPVLSMRLGFSDAGNNPEETTTRQAYDLLAEGFGAGSNGQIILVTELDGEVDPAGLLSVTEAIASTEGVANVSGPTPNTLTDADLEVPTAAVWQVQSQGAPQDAETTDLVNALRSEVLPGAEPMGTDILVTGFVAVTVDFSEYLSSRHVAVLRGSAHAQLPASDGGLPIPAGSPQGSDHEPPVDRCGLRIDGGGVPVGLAEQHHRAGTGSRGTFPAAGAVRDRVRPVDGLRGVPAVAHARGVGTHGQRQGVRGRRPRRHGPGDHRRGRHHGLRVRQLHARGRPFDPAVRIRTCDSGVARRDDRSDVARARDDGAAG